MIALSWSRFSDYIQCPKKFSFKYIEKADNFIAKNEDEVSPHLLFGSKVHKHLEDYVVARSLNEEPDSCDIQEVLNGIVLADKVLAEYGSANVVAEQKLCINSAWKPTDWFAPDAYIRAIVDMSAYAPTKTLAVDWKTGKFTNYTPKDGFGQLELTAGFMFALSNVPQVETRYAFVKHRKLTQKVYNLEDFDSIRSHFDALHHKINTDETFTPQKNQFCFFCPATKSQCPFGSKVDR